MKTISTLFIGWILFVSAAMLQIGDASKFLPSIQSWQVNHPSDNIPTQARLELGRKLFFDPIMSADGSISCASCHNPNFAFSDDKQVSEGVNGLFGTQNAPSILNVAFHPYFTRAGGVPTLEMQVLVPIQEHNEFGSNILEIAERMMQDSVYVEMSCEAYGREPDAFVITRSLACFERSLISNKSKFDRFIEGSTQLTATEMSGMKLFFSDRATCYSCHSGINFTDYSFQNNGLYLHYADSGRFRFSENEFDRALFKVPSLRNLGYTAPYMHDGSLNSLEDVINHYSEGIISHKNLSSQLEPLKFSNDEKKMLLAFLATLNDSTIQKNQWYLNK